MTQEERDRLCTLKKTKKKMMTQQTAAAELGVTLRHVRRLLVRLKEQGDKSVVHGLKGQPSQRRIAEKTEQAAVQILSAPLYAGFGPTLAAEYLGDTHGIEASEETVSGAGSEAKPLALEDLAGHFLDQLLDQLPAIRTGIATEGSGRGW
jgi:Homeodomain-like domain